MDTPSKKLKSWVEYYEDSIKLIGPAKDTDLVGLAKLIAHGDYATRHFCDDVLKRELEAQN